MYKIIFLPIETKTRELEGQLMIAREALKRDYKVIIGHKLFCLKIAEELGLGFYIYKSCQPKMFPKKNSDFIFAILDAEGLYQNSDQNYIRRHLCNLNSDYIFTWGEYQYNLLKSNLKKLNNSNIKIVNSGNPRIDLISENKSLFDKDKSVITILMATNFAIANQSPHYNLIYENKDKKYENELINDYINLINKLSVFKKKVKIILRPHPSENIDFWEKVMTQHNFVSVDRNTSLLDQLNIADFILHSGSTVGIEATILDKKVITYVPNSNYGEISSTNLLPQKIGHIINNFQSLESVFFKAIKGEDHIYANDNTLLKKYISNIDRSSSSAEIIMDTFELNHDLISSKKVKINISSKIRFKSLNFSIKRLLRYRLEDINIKYLSNKLVHSKIHKYHKEGVIKKGEIYNFINKIDDKLIKEADFIVKKLAYNTYLVDKL